MKDLEMILKVIMKNDTAKDLGQINKDIENIKSQIQKLSQVASGAKIIPNLSADQAKKAISELTVEYEKLKKEAEEVGAETNKALGSGINQTDLQPKIQNLKEVSSTLSQITGGLLDFGRSAIEQAAKIGKFNSVIQSHSSSMDEATDAIKNYTQFATQVKQPFKLEEIAAVTAEMKLYEKNIKDTGISIKDLLPKIADFAAANKTAANFSETGEIITKSLSGVRGGITQLQSVFGITKEKLIELGAATKAGGEIDKDSMNTKLAVIKVLNEFNGAAEKASDGYTASLNRLDNEITALKVQIGTGLLPVVIEWIKRGGDLVSFFLNMSDGAKSLVSNTVLIAGGISIVASGAMSAVIRVNEFSLACKAMGMTIGGTTAAIAGTAIVLGIIGNSYIDAWKKMEEMKSEKIVSEIQEINKSVGTLKESIDLVNKTPIDIAIKGGADKELEGLRLQIKRLLEAAAADVLNNTSFAPKGVGTETATPDFEGGVNIKTTIGEPIFGEKEIEAGESFAAVIEKVSAGYEKLNKIQDKTSAQYKDEKENLDMLTCTIIDEITIMSKSSDTTKEDGLVLANFSKDLNKLYDSYRNVGKAVEEQDSILVKSAKNWQDIGKIIEQGIASLSSKELISPSAAADKMKAMKASAHDAIEYYNDLKSFREKYEIDESEGKKKQNAALLNLTKELGKAELGAQKEIHDNRMNDFESYTNEQKKDLNSSSDSYENYYKSIQKYASEHQGEMENDLKFREAVEKELYNASKGMLDAFLNDQKEGLQNGTETYRDYYNNIKEWATQHADLIGKDAKLEQEVNKALIEASSGAWKEFNDSEERALSTGKESYQDYYKAIKGYMDSHTTELQQNAKLREEIEKKVEDAKLQADKAYEDASMKMEKEIAEATPSKLDDIQVEYEAKVKALNLEVKEHEKAGQSKKDIDRWYYIELNKLAEDYQQKTKEYNEQELQDKIKLKEQILNLQKAEEEAPGNTKIFEVYEKEGEYLKQQYDLQKQIVDSMAAEGEPLLLRIKAGQSATDVEKKNASLYVDQKLALDAIGDKIVENTNAELSGYEKKKQALETYVKMSVATNRMGYDQGAALLKSFVEKNFRDIDAASKAALADIDKNGVQAITESTQTTFQLWDTVFQDLGKSGSTLGANLKNSMKNVNTETSKSNQLMSDLMSEIFGAKNNTDSTTTSMNTLGKSIGQATNQASQLAGQMQEVGNVTAKAVEGMGNFMDMQTALSNLPGSGNNLPGPTPPMGKTGAGNQGNMPGASGQGQGGNVPGSSGSGGWNTGQTTDPYLLAGQAAQQYMMLYNKPEATAEDQQKAYVQYQDYLKQIYSGNFDNPINDKKADSLGFSAVFAALGKSATDMAKNVDNGMLSAVSALTQSFKVPVPVSQNTNTRTDTVYNQKQIAINLPSASQLPPQVKDATDTVTNYALKSRLGVFKR